MNNIVKNSQNVLHTESSDFVEKYAIRKCKKLKNRSKQQGKGDLRLSLSFCL